MRPNGRDLHRDQRGLETLQVVVIVAVAAVFLAVVLMFWDRGGGGIWKSVRAELARMVGWDAAQTRATGDVNGSDR